MFEDRILATAGWAVAALLAASSAAFTFVAPVCCASVRSHDDIVPAAEGTPVDFLREKYCLFFLRDSHRRNPSETGTKTKNKEKMRKVGKLGEDRTPG